MSIYQDRLAEYMAALAQASGRDPTWEPPYLPPQMPQQPGMADQLVDVGGKLIAKKVMGSGGNEIATPQILNGTPVAETGVLGNFGSMGIGPQAGIVIGTTLAAKAGMDMLKGKDPKGPGGKFGRAQLGVVTGGLSEVGKLLGGFGKGYSNLEDRLRENLAEKGIKLTGDNAWENNAAFAQSRNESDLLGKDIIGAATMYQIPGYERVGNDIREQIANKALADKLVREHNGGMEMTANEDFLNYASGLIGSAPAPKPTPLETYRQKLAEYMKARGANA